MPYAHLILVYNLRPPPTGFSTYLLTRRELDRDQILAIFTPTRRAASRAQDVPATLQNCVRTPTAAARQEYGRSGRSALAADPGALFRGGARHTAGIISPEICVIAVRRAAAGLRAQLQSNAVGASPGAGITRPKPVAGRARAPHACALLSATS